VNGAAAEVLAGLSVPLPSFAAEAPSPQPAVRFQRTAVVEPPVLIRSQLPANQKPRNGGVLDLLVAPTGIEPATSALRGGPKLRNGQEHTGTNGRLNWDYRVLTELGGIVRKRSFFVGCPVIVPSLGGLLHSL